MGMNEKPTYEELDQEVLNLREENAALAEKLRIAEEGRHFFYQDAKAYHDMAMRLKQENSNLRAQLATHTNPEDTYRDDFSDMFIDEADIIRETFRRA